MALPFASSSTLRSIRLDPRIQAKNLVYRPLDELDGLGNRFEDAPRTIWVLLDVGTFR
jgi:hypothetical protein